MPEGHTIHRLANDHRRMFAGHEVRASSPQGRFTEGAALIDGQVLRRTEAYGKHLLHHYGPAGAGGHVLHVHLGLYGKFAAGTGEPPEPRGALRLRLVGNDHWTDLRGATACELITPGERRTCWRASAPTRCAARSTRERAFARISRSKVVIAALLMDQEVLAGIGNVYRAEILFRHRVDPFLPGRLLPEERWAAMWDDLAVLMRAGVTSGRIVTVRPRTARASAAGCVATRRSTSTGAPASRAGSAAPRSARRCSCSATCSGARTARRRAAGEPRYLRMISRMPATISTLPWPRRSPGSRRRASSPPSR